MTNGRTVLRLAALTVAVLAVSATVGASLAAFRSITQNAGSSLQTDTLAAPTNLTASGSPTVNLSWTATTSAWATGYRIYRGTSAGGPYSQIAQVTGVGTTSYSDSPGGGSFYYVVRAYYGTTTWVSPETNEVNVRISTYATTVLATTGLIGYWRLGESSGTTAADSKGTHTGTYVNGVTLGATGALNESNTAASFDGADDHVSIPNANALRPNRLSVEAWVKGGGGLADWDTVLMKTGNSSWPNGYGLYWNGGNIYFFVNNFSTAAVSTSLTADEWTHIVGTYDRTTIRLYKDGVQVASLPYTTAITHSTTPLTIGAGGGCCMWSGEIDEVAFYNVALTAAQVSNHYNAR
jgi:hypothetical protein